MTPRFHSAAEQEAIISSATAGELSVVAISARLRALFSEQNAAANEYFRANRRKKNAAGVCSYCTEPTCPESSTMCQEHRVKHRQDQLARRRELAFELSTEDIAARRILGNDGFDEMRHRPQRRA